MRKKISKLLRKFKISPKIGGVSVAGALVIVAQAIIQGGWDSELTNQTLALLGITGVGAALPPVAGSPVKQKDLQSRYRPH